MITKICFYNPLAANGVQENIIIKRPYHPAGIYIFIKTALVFASGIIRKLGTDGIKIRTSCNGLTKTVCQLVGCCSIANRVGLSALRICLAGSHQNMTNVDGVGHRTGCLNFSQLVCIPFKVWSENGSYRCL